jgi:hypothetical protein
VETALERNLKRGFQPLRARTDERAALAEVFRDQLLTDIEALIEKAHTIDPVAAVEFEQQRKILRLRNQAEYWLARRHVSALALLRNA